MSVLSHGSSSLLVDRNNRPIASIGAPTAPEPVADLLQLETQAFLCRAHGAWYRNRSVLNDVIRDAHVAILLTLPKLEHVLAHCDTEAQAIGILEARRPWCCFLSSGGRRALVRLAAEGESHVRSILADRVEQLRTAITSRTARILAGAYRLRVDDVLYAMATIRDPQQLRALLESVKGEDSSHVVAAIDALAAQL